MRRHKSSQHDGIKYKCDHCDKMYTDRRALVNHIKSVHEKIIFKCPELECDFQTHAKVNLYRHRKLCHDQDLYQCEDCEYRTAMKGDFNRHRNQVHLKQIVFQCCSCDFRSFRRDHLKKHFEKSHISCDPPCSYVSKSYKDHLHHVRAKH